MTKSSSNERSKLPGFRLSLGVSLFYLSIVVIAPLATLPLLLSTLSFEQISAALFVPRVLAALKLSLSVAFAAALADLVLGFLLAWVLARYSFPGKRILDALIDLPFALPTAVAGISFASLYAPNGWLGALLNPLGIKVAFTWLGIFITLTFVGLPFVVRSVQPVLAGLDQELEAAAATLGASRLQTFIKVTFPLILPSMISGTSLSFARAIGEYGSVVFISGNLPFKTEIVPLLIMTRLEEFNYPGAAILAVIILVISFSVMFLANTLQFWASRRAGAF